MSTFYEWLVKTYRGECDPLGDLAEYMALAEDAEHAPNTHDGMREYFESHGASKVELDVFEEAWMTYHAQCLAQRITEWVEEHGEQDAADAHSA